MEHSTLQDVLGRPMDGVCRILLRHERRSRFRWMGLVEISVGLVLCVCLIPILLIAALTGSDIDIDLPTLSGRLWHNWHEIVLILSDVNGEALQTLQHTPTSAAEGEGMIASVLAAADRQGVVVVESIGGAVAEVVEVWYGGQPLLSHPEKRDTELLSQRLRSAGLDIEEAHEQIILSQPMDPHSPFWSAVVLLLFFLPLTAVLFWSQAWREQVGEVWKNVRGIDPGRREVSVTAAAITARRVRGERVWNETRVDGYELLGLTFSPTLGYSGEIKRNASTLRCIGRDHTITMPMPLPASMGRMLRDWLIATSLQLRAEKPELGLAGDGPRPTRCPYCATLYVFQPGTPCPSCGGWPEQLGD